MQALKASAAIDSISTDLCNEIEDIIEETVQVRNYIGVYF